MAYKNLPGAGRSDRERNTKNGLPCPNLPNGAGYKQRKHEIGVAVQKFTWRGQARQRNMKNRLQGPSLPPGHEIQRKQVIGVGIQKITWSRQARQEEHEERFAVPKLTLRCRLCKESRRKGLPYKNLSGVGRPDRGTRRTGCRAICPKGQDMQRKQAIRVGEQTLTWSRQARQRNMRNGLPCPNCVGGGSRLQTENTGKYGLIKSGYHHLRTQLPFVENYYKHKKQIFLY